MGAAHSRARPGSGPTRGVKFTSAAERMMDQDASNGSDNYFILCIKNGDRGDKIKVVNASGSVHKLLTAIIRRNMVIAKSGWDRHLVFSYKLDRSNRGRYALIQVLHCAKIAKVNRSIELIRMNHGHRICSRIHISSQKWPCFKLKLGKFQAKIAKFMAKIAKFMARIAKFMAKLAKIEVKMQVQFVLG